ncbi:flagellar hook protein FlgE [Acidimangrovimonas pyrenivorans]|uniref:Flagellar hook protein FlgE n=1 Tax=Acidimangrovimonas pyrenivorans TaxID=2030798 RepID=A0ABV7AM52_9RHOB
MSISSALQTAVSGLFANSTAVGRISENIANANTDGYKRRFAQMVTTTAAGSEYAPSGVMAVTGTSVTQGGALNPSSSVTDMAIDGNGFFIVSSAPNDPVQSHYMLTRAGSFVPDGNGNLVNSAGYYLAGYQYDPNGSLGQVDRSSFSGMNTVNVSNARIDPSATTTVNPHGNLPSQETGQTPPGAAFTSSTEFYDALGAPGRLQFSWQPTATDNQWVVTVSDDAGVTYGDVTVDFNDSGANAGTPALYSNINNTAPAPAAFAFNAATGTATLTINNGAVPQTIDVAFGAPGTSDGMTQFAGDFTPQTFDKDGSGVGNLTRVEIDDKGNLNGVFDNGMRKALYQIPVGHVDNPDGLITADGNAYKLSNNSGVYSNFEANTGPVGGIASNALEGSNVDIAQELSDLIRTQRAYSTNAKVVTTMDDMLSQTTQLKR